MREYKKYDEYKDSGVEWIGEIPEEWDTVKTSYLFKDIGSGTTPKGDKLIYYNGDINWLITGDLNDGYIYRTKKTITKKALLDHSTLKIYPKNSIVIAMYGATIGKLGILADEMATNQACCILSGVENGDPRYYFYWFLANRNYLVSLAQGGGQKNINQDLIKNFITLKPTNKDIKKIASFLDKRTAEIDKIINKKETLIDYLEKYKKTVITEAVTKGKLGNKYLNEDGELVDEIKMKDSGIEWIGEMPEHSEITKAKYISDMKRGAILRPVDNPEYYDESGHWTYLNISDVSSTKKYLYNGKLNLSKLGSQKSLRVESGNVIVTASATIGIPFINKIDVCIHDGFIAFTNNKLSNEYLYYYLLNEFLYSNIGKTNTQKNIYLSEAKNFPIIIFNKKLQKIIVNKLNEKLKQINNLIQKTRKSIQRYKEYKKSLIFEAVTGKIDLRDYELEGGEEFAEHNNSSETERERLSAVD